MNLAAPETLNSDPLGRRANFELLGGEQDEPGSGILGRF
jgi:hypothetical protein